MRIMSISRFSFLSLVTATVLLQADGVANTSSFECQDEWYMPYPTFPGCNDTSILCSEDSHILENCCKCRCDAMHDPPNSDPCYIPPYVPPSPSPEDEPNGSNLTSDQVLVSVNSSPAPSMPTAPEPTPPPTNYYQNWQQNGGGGAESTFFNRVIFIFFALFFPIFFSLVMKKRNQLRHHRRHRRYRAARAERLRRAAMQQEGLTVPNAADDAARYERIKSKFYFQQVLPDQSNVNADSLKGRATSNDISRDGGDVERQSSPKAKGDLVEKKIKEEVNTTEDAESTAEENAVDESLHQSASSVVHKTSSHHHPSLCEVISSWASVGSVPPPSDVCCICLEGYSCGETICVAKKPSCDHLFHKDCLLEWMKTNDECPLCRINLLY